MEDQDKTAIDSLRADVKSGQNDFQAKYSARIDIVENVRPWAALIAVLGTTLAGFSRLIPNTLGVATTVAGAVAAIICSGLVAWLDRKKLEIGQNAKDALNVADRALDLAGKLKTRLTTVERAAAALDDKRRSRLKAIEEMTVDFEAGLISGSDDETTAKLMLQRAIDNIRRAIDFRGNDILSVSIMRVEGVGKNARLARVATEWNHPTLANQGIKTLNRGQGYSGAAWVAAESNALEDLIIPDTSPEHISKKYVVADADPEIEKYYCSVAAIPILIKRSNQVWGVVFAASNRSGVFAPDEAKAKAQNVDMIRDVARLMALCAGLKRAPDLMDNPAR